MPPEEITEETIAAARLRLVLDEKLGRPTPKRVHEIAAMTAPVPRQESVIPPRPRSGVLSVDEFKAAAPDALAGGRRSLLLIGVDGRLGGVTGAAVLRVLGSVVRGALEPEDLFAQFGPHEFVALVAGSGAEVAERIQADVREQDWSLMLGEGQSLQVSVGVTGARRDEPFDEMMVRADEALDEARAGQNRPSG